MSSVSGLDNNISKIYQSLSSGKKINSAADDAAGLAISEKMQTQLNGYDKGISNTEDMKNLARTAEGGLANINDSLQRIRELAVAAKNGVASDEDRQIYQDEVSMLLDEIQRSAQSTEFNRIKLLDGNFADANVASSPSGDGMKISIRNSSLSSLGLEDFDVTKDFDIGVIDSAMQKVTGARAKIGATSNAMDYNISANAIAQNNTAEAQSRVADTDMAKSTMKLKQAQLLQDMQISLAKKKNEDEKVKLNILG